MQITKVQFNDFKSFETAVVEDLTDVNMVFGYNNSGKSNFLKFLELIFMRKKSIPGVTYATQDENEGPEKLTLEKDGKGNFWDGIIENYPYIFRGDDFLNKKIKYKIYLSVYLSELENTVSNYVLLRDEYFPDTPDTIEIIIEGNITGINNNDSQCNLDKVELAGRVIYGGETLELFEDSANETIEQNSYEIFVSLLSIFNDSIILLDNDRFIKPEVEDREIVELSHKNFKNWLFNLSLNPTRYQDFKDLISGIKSFKARSTHEFNAAEKSNPLNNFVCEFARFEKQIELMLKNDFNRLPLSSYGTGVQQILFILAKLFSNNSKIVLIEEIELNLSPIYQKILIQNILLNYIQKKNKLHQLFFTTHSPHMCYRNDFQILKTTINNEGVSSISKAERDEIKKYSGCKVMSS